MSQIDLGVDSTDDARALVHSGCQETGRGPSLERVRVARETWRRPVQALRAEVSLLGERKDRSGLS